MGGEGKVEKERERGRREVGEWRGHEQDGCI